MIGRMRHLVTIQTRDSGQDSHGQPVDTWSDTTQVWADIKSLRGREFYAGSGERAEITHEIRMRYGVSITSTQRITYEGRVFDIAAPIDMDNRERFLVVRAIERGQ